MASRDFLKIMKLARSGDASAQQKIGEIYLLGSDGTPQNTPNALLWLEKASLSIGFIEDISSLVANHLHLNTPLSREQAQFALRCLMQTANTGHSRARWLIAQTIARVSQRRQAALKELQVIWAFAPMTDQDWTDVGGLDNLKAQAHRYLEELSDLPSFENQPSALQLLSECLQDGRLGIVDATRAKKIMLHLASIANEEGLRSLVSSLASFGGVFDKDLVPALELHLQRLLQIKKPFPEHILLYWAAWQYLQNVDALEIAAELAYTPAQLALGLRLAKLNLKDKSSQDISTISADLEDSNTDTGGNARLKRAVYWLKQAANKGERDAWYALGLINRMPQYSGYSAQDSDNYFDKAADLGHPEAQYRKGAALWRKRAQLEEEIEGLQASYWIWHAAQQGVVAAQELLSKVMLSCAQPEKNRWHALALATSKALSESSHRFNGDLLLTCHRVMVANQLNLSKAELLLIDVPSVQHEHGAVIDIREHLPRSTPKLILIETLEQRKALMMASKAFANAFSNHVIDEGNLRQRRYRLEKLMEVLEVSDDSKGTDESESDDAQDLQ